MNTEELIKITIRLNTTQEEYRKGALLAERKNGRLRFLPFMIVFSAVCILLGFYSVQWFYSPVLSVLFPLVISACCPLILLFVFWIIPKSIEKQADIDFITYEHLMKEAELFLNTDHMITQSPVLCCKDQYALMDGCIETPEFFVFLKDHERFLVLPKRCFQPENMENADNTDEITMFLRDVFARKRFVMKSWIF